MAAEGGVGRRRGERGAWSNRLARCRTKPGKLGFRPVCPRPLGDRVFAGGRSLRLHPVNAGPLGFGAQPAGGRATLCPPPVGCSLPLLGLRPARAAAGIPQRLRFE